MAYSASLLNAYCTSSNAFYNIIRQLSKAQELWSGERSRLQSEQQRLIGERNTALDNCDNSTSATASASSEKNRDLIRKRDILLAQHGALQTEHDKVWWPHSQDTLGYLLRYIFFLSKLFSCVFYWKSASDWFPICHCCYCCMWQVLGERDDLLRQLKDLKQQKQDVLGSAHQMSLQLNTAQVEVSRCFN